jgi:riboflavin biosynthesis pyrimidine reductase
LIQQWDQLSRSDIVARYEWPSGSWGRANIVVDSLGKISGADGTSESLTSANDRFLLNILRGHTDLLVIGAQSVRSEGWFLPPHGRMAVVTRSGQLPPGCPEPERVDAVNLDELLPHLDSTSHWLCEGGADVLTQLIQSTSLDELCVTISGWTPATPVALPGWLVQRGTFAYIARSLIFDGDSLFTIWRRAKN